LITRIAPAADAKSRVFDVELTIQNPPAQLKLGMIVSLEVSTEKPAEPVPVVPLTAIVRPRNNPQGYAICVISEESGRQVTRIRPVRLGEVFGNLIAVTEGVKPGERVVVTGVNLVSDGEMVVVANYR
jgi:multidrug efflux pump subunit AcrA (membrane-fusion protein)